MEDRKPHLYLLVESENRTTQVALQYVNKNITYYKTLNKCYYSLSGSYDLAEKGIIKCYVYHIIVILHLQLIQFWESVQIIK